MSAAETAAHTALQISLKPLAAFFGGKSTLDILLNPGLVPDDVVQAQFVAIPKPEQSEGAEEQEPKLLGSLPGTLQALYASIKQGAEFLVAATTAFEEFSREHQRRHHHNAIDDFYSDKAANESEEESTDEGCVAMHAAHDTLRGFGENLSRRRDTFWALIKDQYPDAGNMSITASRTVVETAPKFDDLASQLPPGLAEALMGGGILGGLVEVKIGKGAPKGPSGGLLDGLMSILSGRRRRGPGPN
jgi:hypothetical protein